LTGSIARVEAVDVRVPLPQPLQLGAMRIESRGYAVVTVTTDDGLTGHAIALNRDTPVAAAVNGVLARALVGTPADRIGEAWERCSTPPSPRAASAPSCVRSRSWTSPSGT
jgi:L-alanine-DL-glutamate epimerase-like enolase superfamily enzyme